MKTSKQLREERGLVDGEILALRNKYEGTEMSAEDAAKYRDLLDKLEKFGEDIELAERGEKAALEAAKRTGTGSSKTDEKELEQIAKDFSFGAAVRAAYGVGKLTGVEKEMHEEGEKEMRSVGQAASGIVIPGSLLNKIETQSRANVTINGTGGVQVQNFVDAVYAETILGDLGVTRTQTTTDQRIPIIGAVTTQWEGEVDAAADGGSALSKVDLTPTRLASYVNYSKQAAMQHNDSLEAALRRNIAQSMAAKIEYAVFTDDTSAGGPADIGAGKTAVTGATVNAMVLALMEQVIGNNHNKGNLGFAVSHSLFSELYTAVLVSGVSPLVVNEMIMGKKFRISSQIADIASGQESIYYGDWSKLQMAQFGGVEILADPYTQAVSGMNRLVLNSYWDFALVQGAAISVAGYTG